jgi:hypothetical protein
MDDSDIAGAQVAERRPSESEAAEFSSSFLAAQFFLSLPRGRTHVA